MPFKPAKYTFNSTRLSCAANVFIKLSLNVMPSLTNSPIQSRKALVSWCHHWWRGRSERRAGVVSWNKRVPWLWTYGESLYKRINTSTKTNALWRQLSCTCGNELLKMLSLLTSTSAKKSICLFEKSLHNTVFATPLCAAKTFEYKVNSTQQCYFWRHYSIFVEPQCFTAWVQIQFDAAIVFCDATMVFLLVNSLGQRLHVLLAGCFVPRVT